MRPLIHPAAILFDMGGTLLRQKRWEPAAGTRQVLGLARNDPSQATIEQVEEAVRRLDADLSTRREASMMEISPWAVQRLVYERFRIEFTASPREIEATFLHSARSWTPEPGIHEALRATRSLGVRMAVVSNSAFSSEALTHELAEHGVAEFFEFVMSSADYVVRKPHPILFRTAAGKLGVSASATWYVGNSYRYDIAGARAANMSAIHYTAEGKGGGVPTPDAAFSNWDQFADLVESACSKPGPTKPAAQSASGEASRDSLSIGMKKNRFY